MSFDCFCIYALNILNLILAGYVYIKNIHASFYFSYIIQFLGDPARCHKTIETPRNPDAPNQM